VGFARGAVWSLIATPHNGKHEFQTTHFSEKPMTPATSRISDLLRTAAALTACLMIGATATAQAAAAADATPSVRVNYRDLNLATEQGTQALYGRIVSAARKVCAPSDIRILVEVAAAQTCEAQAVAHAVRAVNNPQLAATYSAHQRQG
jgi:UrcA family protein